MSWENSVWPITICCLPIMPVLTLSTFCQCRATAQWFSSGTLVSSTNTADRHDITEILLKVALNTINQTRFTRIQFYSIKHNYPELDKNEYWCKSETYLGCLCYHDKRLSRGCGHWCKSETYLGYLCDRDKRLSRGWGHFLKRGTCIYIDMPLECVDFFNFRIYDWVINFQLQCVKSLSHDKYKYRGSYFYEFPTFFYC